jgi:dihydroflavonol-4-reductase
LLASGLVNDMTSPILVTGGAGFIGSHLVRRLTQTEARVRVLERPGAAVSHLPARDVDVLFADVRNQEAVRQAVRGCRQVYHLAANPQLWTQKRGTFFQVNTRGTVNVLSAALEEGAERVLHVSTESILTHDRQRGQIDEGQRIRLHDAIGPYCRSKYLAERYAFDLALRGAPVVVVNPTLPIGPGDWGKSPPTQMLLDFCRGGRRAYIEGELNLIDVRDVAIGIVLAMERGRYGKRYLLGSENMSVLQVFGELARLTGLPPPRMRVPYALALATAYISEWLAVVFTHRPPAATVTGVKLTRRKMHFDTARSLIELGLTCRPISESLADALAWFQAVGWLRQPVRQGH